MAINSLERAATLMVRLLDVKGGVCVLSSPWQHTVPRGEGKALCTIVLLGKRGGGHMYTRPGKRSGAKGGGGSDIVTLFEYSYDSK